MSTFLLVNGKTTAAEDVADALRRTATTVENGGKVELFLDFNDKSFWESFKIS